MIDQIFTILLFVPSIEQNFYNFTTLINFLLTIYGSFILYRNRQTTKESFRMHKDTIRTTTYDCIFIETKELKKDVIAKLVVFNPGSIKMLLRCVKVYQRKKWENRVFDLLKIERFYWERIPNKWWPSDEEFNHERYVSEEYRKLLVTDVQDIYVKIPGKISYHDYKFEIITSLGTMWLQTSLTGTKTNFSYHYGTEMKES